VAWEPGGPTPPWPRITEYVVDHAGRRRDLTPHGLRIRTEDGAGHSGYSWNGLDDDPNGYRIFQGRYQTTRARTGNACLAFADLAQAIASADISNQGIRQSLRAKSAEAERAWARRSSTAAGNGLCAVLAEVGAQRGGGISIPSAADLCACTDELVGSLDIPMECGGP